MSKVSIEFLSWLTETVGQPKVHEVVLDWEIGEGSTVKDILVSVAKTYPAFKKSVFDTRGEKLSGAVGIYINGCQLELAEGLETRLKDRDALTLFPVLAGG